MKNVRKFDKGDKIIFNIFSDPHEKHHALNTDGDIVTSWTPKEKIHNSKDSERLENGHQYVASYLGGYGNILVIEEQYYPDTMFIPAPEEKGDA